MCAEPQPPSTEEVLRIAVLSDLHAYDQCAEESSEPSHLCTVDAEDQPGKHPIVGLKDLIARQGLSANLLLCPGDFGDKARPAGIKYAWSAIHNVAGSLNAQRVAATVGNHDVDSRFKYSDHDPKGFLQSLDPPFPFGDDQLNDRFWSRNFAIIEENNCRILVLNSSAFHGGRPEEIARGRVSDRTLTQLESSLGNSATKPVNILLCHHHPHKHSEIELGEFDEILGGQLLLQLLGSGRFGEWIVIHGHKHHPKLSYAAGGANAPVVFSAGSLCCKLYAKLGTRARNQFYLLTFPIGQIRQHGLVGTFAAWDWTTGQGWQPARLVGSGLPGNGGFGHRGNLNVLAGRIANLVSGGARNWSDILASEPLLDFILPDDVAALFASLKTQHNVEVLRGDDERPRQLGFAT